MEPWLAAAVTVGVLLLLLLVRSARSTRPTSIESSHLSVLDAVRRGNIIADFGEALEAHSHHIYGISEGVLPDPRALIEQALREELLATSDPDRINALEVGYMHLAQFLPEPDGSVAMGITRTMAAWPPAGAAAAREYVDDPGRQAAMEQSGRLSRLVAERTEKALTEVRQLRAFREERQGR